MYMRALTLGLAGIVLAAAPGSAQERGTIEFGAFGNWTFYDSSINVNDGWGLGGRVGAFIIPALSVEFDMGRRFASRPLGLEDVEVEAFAARLVLVPVRMGSVSLLAGAGFIHTDYDAGISDGVQALLGAKVDIGPTVALRMDAVMDFNENDTNNLALQAGVSLYRHPVRSGR